MCSEQKEYFGKCFLFHLSQQILFGHFFHFWGETYNESLAIWTMCATQVHKVDHLSGYVRAKYLQRRYQALPKCGHSGCWIYLPTCTAEEETHQSAGDERAC